MAELSRSERVLSRARSLMANRGIGWSKALEMAADTLGPEAAPAATVEYLQTPRNE